MKYIKSYKKFKESIVIDLGTSTVQDLLESLNIWYDTLLNSIDAEEINIFDTFKLPADDYEGKLDLDYLTDNIEFINSLSSIALKKSEVKNSEDYETFLSKPCKFMFIYDINSNELENPAYLLFQVWNKTLNKWEDVKLYKINQNVNHFYQKLGSKTIEIIDDTDKYIYQTSNTNEWTLQNIEKESDKFKKYFRKDEFDKFLSDNKFKINII